MNEEDDRKMPIAIERQATRQTNRKGGNEHACQSENEI
jgi:hypothetical protein